MFELYKVKSFTDQPAQGNLAGVVLSAESLSDQEMQKIVTEVGASETAAELKDSDINYPGYKLLSFLLTAASFGRISIYPSLIFL